MKLLVDGKEVECDDVRVIHEDQLLDENGNEGEVHIQCTHEGIIVDVVEDGEVTKTMCQEVCDLVEMTQ